MRLMFNTIVLFSLINSPVFAGGRASSAPYARMTIALASQPASVPRVIVNVSPVREPLRIPDTRTIQTINPMQNQPAREIKFKN